MGKGKRGETGLMEKQNPTRGSTEKKGGLVQVWEAAEKSFYLYNLSIKTEFLQESEHRVER